ncbi:MAG: hypothetical protein ACRYFS_14105 [Janthinobacterium lividum]
MESALGAGFAMLSLFGGTALIIWTSTQARIARIKAEAQARQMTAAPESDSNVVAELKALQRQMAEMAGTSHQFDISFDAALERMEGRVNRLETKSAAGSAVTTENTQTLRNGQGQ